MDRGRLEYLSVPAQVGLFERIQSLSAPGSRFAAWNGDPWCKDWTASIGVAFPHIGFQTVEETKANLAKTGWSKNISVLDDDIFWARYKRAMNLPLYIILAESDKGKTTDEPDL